MSLKDRTPHPWTVEQRIDEWSKQSGHPISLTEQAFIRMMREFSDKGCGYGWMTQMIEWEWSYQLWQHLQKQK